MQVPFEVVMAALSVVGSGGIAWGAVRAGLNGTRGDVKEIRTTLQAHVNEDHRLQVEQVEIVTRIETKLDGMIEDLDDERAITRKLRER